MATGTGVSSSTNRRGRVEAGGDGNEGATAIEVGALSAADTRWSSGTNLEVATTAAGGGLTCDA